MVVCAELLATGSCNNEDCTRSHFLGFCRLCKSRCTTPASYAAHVKGKFHAKMSYNGGAGDSGECGVCHVIYAPSASLAAFLRHTKDARHHRLALQNPDQFFDPEAETDEAPAGSQTCMTCSRIIPDSSWESHVNGWPHRRAETYRRTTSVFEELERDKNGVEVSYGDGGMDFGVVEWSSLRTRPTISDTFKITANTSASIKLVTARLSSSLGAQAGIDNKFFSGKSQLGPLTRGIPRVATATFDPKGQRGRFEDRLEFIFEDTSIGQRFAITRALRAVVGVQEDLEALKPIAPYVRPKRRRYHSAPDQDVKDGIKPPALAEIEWLVKLPSFLIPSEVFRAVAAGSRQDKIDRVKSVLLPTVLNPSSYARHWRTLLHIEEAQMKDDLEQYDMEGKTLARAGNFYYIDVPGLAEKRPSVIVGDSIRVRHSGGRDHWWRGYVHKVEEKRVALLFNPTFNAFPAQHFDIRFDLGRIPLRRMHQGLATAFSPSRILFPDQAEHHAGLSKPSRLEVDGLRVYNRLLQDNRPQREAVASMLHQSPGSVPFVVFGPPGTGKTVVVVEAIRQILSHNPKAKILACAPSNSAADLLADRLRQQGLGVSELFRLNAPSRLRSALLTSLVPHSKSNDSGTFCIPELAQLSKYRVVVSTCLSAGVPHGIGMPRGHFTHLFLDEAGQALETEAMIAIKTLAGPLTNIVLSGDPKQLGPIVRSGVAADLGLGVSYLDRLMASPLYDENKGHGTTVVKLIKNFRSHPSILYFPNKQFYKGELETHADPMITHSLDRWSELISPSFPIIFHGISGKDMREASSPSFFNPDEVSLVKHYVQLLRADQRLRLTDDHIGIISPYNAQCAKIRSVINTPALRARRTGFIKVGSVEEFQGQERRVIILSTVRSSTEFVNFDVKHTLGFVGNVRRFNVAVTRAQALLIVIGDPTILALDPMWRSFLDYIHSHGGWTGKAKHWNSNIEADRDTEHGFGRSCSRGG